MARVRTVQRVRNPATRTQNDAGRSQTRDFGAESAGAQQQPEAEGDRQQLNEQRGGGRAKGKSRARSLTCTRGAG